MTTPIIMRFDVQDDGSVKVATINSNLAQLGNGLNHVSSQSSYFTRAMGFVKTALGSIQSVIFSMQGALAGLGIALTATSFIKTASDMETLRVRMQLLTGSVSEGNKMFDMAAGYAEKVTYEYLDIMNAAVMLRSALNTSNEETMRLVQMAGDLAARSGMPIQEAAASSFACGRREQRQPSNSASAACLRCSASKRGSNTALKTPAGCSSLHGRIHPSASRVQRKGSRARSRVCSRCCRMNGQSSS